MMNLCRGLLALVWFVSLGCWADETAKPISVRDADWLIPESPAFAVLNVTPQSVTRPSSPRELALGVLNSLDANGNPQQGLALDLAPYMLMAGDKITIADYREERLIRILSRSQLSLATTKGQNESDKAFRAAASMRVTLWDLGDPRLDKQLDSCFMSAMALPDQPPPMPPGMTEDPEVLRLMRQKKIDAMKPLAASCRQASRKRNWNRSAWDIAAAKVWINPDGSASGLSEGGISVWSSLAYGFEKQKVLRDSAQLIGIIKITHDEQVPDSAIPAVFSEQDSSFIGMRFRFGDERRVFNIEGLQVKTSAPGVSDDRYMRYTLGGDIKINEDVWINVSFGQNSGQTGSTDTGFVKAGLQWGLSKEPRSAAAH